MAVGPYSVMYAQSKQMFMQKEPKVACEPNQESAANVELKINGDVVELNDFVTNFIAQTVAGMIQSLRGVSDIETVDLKISKKATTPQAQ